MNCSNARRTEDRDDAKANRAETAVCSPCICSICFSQRNVVRFALALVDALGIVAAPRAVSIFADRSCRGPQLPARLVRALVVAVVVRCGAEDDGNMQLMFFVMLRWMQPIFS